MNIEELHTLSRIETRNAYNWFEHSVNNPLFEVNDNYINQCIEHMKVDIGCGITKKYYKQLKSDAQWSITIVFELFYSRFQCLYKRETFLTNTLTNLSQ